MSGEPYPLHIKVMRDEADRTDDPEGIFGKLIILESILYEENKPKQPKK